MILKLADIFFFVFHIALILFNLFGWLFRQTRKWNLVTLGSTAFSWFVLGIFSGFGYCFLTDWHWEIRHQLGYENPYNSYIQFLISTLLPISISDKMVDTITAASFFLALIASIVTNFQDWRKRKLNTTPK
jgi:hypothetical protein